MFVRCWLKPKCPVITPVCVCVYVFNLVLLTLDVSLFIWIQFLSCLHPGEEYQYVENFSSFSLVISLFVCAIGGGTVGSELFVL